MTQCVDSPFCLISSTSHGAEAPKARGAPASCPGEQGALLGRGGAIAGERRLSAVGVGAWNSVVRARSITLPTPLEVPPATDTRERNADGEDCTSPR
jgi:hypothetical protein